MHIYDSRFPVAPNAKLRPPDATIDDYRLLQKRIGTMRNVIVTPSTYGVDNGSGRCGRRQRNYRCKNSSA
jgi:D-galactarolactone isomerase